MKTGRNLLLKLHKSLVDFERSRYEALFGPVNSGQFLNLLLNDADFEWLRKYSMLIVEIDELFDLDDGPSDEMLAASLSKMRELIFLETDDDVLKSKYQYAIQNNSDIAVLHSEIKGVLAK